MNPLENWPKGEHFPKLTTCESILKADIGSQTPSSIKSTYVLGTNRKKIQFILPSKQKSPNKSECSSGSLTPRTQNSEKFPLHSMRFDKETKKHAKKSKFTLVRNNNHSHQEKNNIDEAILPSFHQNSNSSSLSLTKSSVKNTLNNILSSRQNLKEESLKEKKNGGKFGYKSIEHQKTSSILKEQNDSSELGKSVKKTQIFRVKTEEEEKISSRTQRLVYGRQYGNMQKKMDEKGKRTKSKWVHELIMSTFGVSMQQMSQTFGASRINGVFLKGNILGIQSSDHMAKLNMNRFVQYLEKANELLREMEKTLTEKTFNRTLFNIINRDLLLHLKEIKGTFVPLICYLFAIGKVFLFFREASKAIHIFLQIKQICKTFGEHEMLMKAYKQLAKANQALKRYKEATNCCGKLLRLAWFKNNRHYESLAYELLGIQHYYIGNIHKSQGFHGLMVDGWYEPEDSEIRRVTLNSYKEEMKRNLKSLVVMNEQVKTILTNTSGKVIIGSVEDSFYEEIDDLLINIESRFDSWGTHISRFPDSSLRSNTQDASDSKKGPLNPLHLTKPARNFKAILSNRSVDLKLKNIHNTRQSEFARTMKSIQGSKRKQTQTRGPLQVSFTEHGIQKYAQLNCAKPAGVFTKEENGESRLNVALDKSASDSDVMLTHLSSCKQLSNFISNHFSREFNCQERKTALELDERVTFSEPNSIRYLWETVQKLILNFSEVSKQIKESF